jgi:hypothetical protein
VLFPQNVSHDVTAKTTTPFVGKKYFRNSLFRVHSASFYASGLHNQWYDSA